MKRFIIFIIITLVGSVAELFAQYQVNCIDTNGETMTFRVVGYGKNAKKASTNAELSVIRAIMFEGIPNTQHSIPMISETESVVFDKHGNALNRFYGGEYKNEILSSVIVRNFGKDANKLKSITLDITVNTRALRNKLEKIGIIRKFGL